MAIVIALLMAFNSPVLDSVNAETKIEITSTQVEDVLFDEDCTSCRYITVYDENDGLVYDQLVIDTENIDDAKLKNILDKSYFLMSNSITDYYIYSE